MSARIFEGDYSVDMWRRINSAETVEDLRLALYLVCCRLQELEAKLDTPRFLRGDRGSRNKSLARLDAWAGRDK